MLPGLRRGLRVLADLAMVGTLVVAGLAAAVGARLVRVVARG
ncbi:MAG: hypothetical protein AAF682_26625 [Planctomycetota bacterium]